MPNTLFLTGPPGVGKTTVIRRVVERVGPRAGGFYTEEVRQGGKRMGFRLVTLAGERAWLARRGAESPYRVGAYGVDVAALDAVGVPAIWEAIHHKEIIIVDEIGRMELFSRAFKEAVLAAIASVKPFLATVMLKPHPWVDPLKFRPDVVVWTVTRDNRDGLPERILRWLESHVEDQGRFDPL